MTSNRSEWARNWFGVPPLFDPAAGTTVIEPLDRGPGWWAGACSALFDEATDRFYLYYRLRKPRDLGRGVECRIAESEDGVRFQDIWTLSKDELNSPSVEKSALVRTLEGRWRLYISFVDPKDGRWRIDMLAGETPARLDPGSRVPILTAADIGAEGVKDPYIVLLGRLYAMIASYAPSVPAPTAEERARMHATGDVYNTGITKSSTGMALSSDGVRWEWLGDVFAPRETGWDRYAARISSLLYLPPVWTAFYDGSASVAENYEERTGMAVSPDLRRFGRVSTEGPALVSPHASGSLRYLDVVPLGDRLFYYYEYAREDGSHELRVNVVTMDNE